MTLLETSDFNNRPKVAIIIPCYRAKERLQKVVEDAKKNLSFIKESFQYEIIIVNDACPFRSWEYINGDHHIKIIHNEYNLGVGASTIKGFKYAMQKGFDAVIKLDADGQHPPKYLKELIPFIFSLPKYKLFLTKGNRYKIKIFNKPIPLLRKIGTLFLDPIARAALGYRGLSDITNGFLAMDSKTANFLLNSKCGIEIEKRYLFESSILSKCSELNIQINEFCMLPNYENNWISSMNAWAMFLPMLTFWLKAILLRLSRKYLASLNLGSILLFISFLNIILCQFLFFTKVLPEIKNGILVTAGTSSAFTSSGILGIISLILFLFYDYGSGMKTSIVFFRCILNEDNN